ncbi:DUF5066 family protein, partial [Salmonella enterica subsp. enterica serovar Anatum]|nr:DUF5066 family protein [Salmonella enterica subsp. enterica serovar Anatum]
MKASNWRGYGAARRAVIRCLSESLKALLAYDRDLLSNYNMPVIETLQRSIDKEGVIHSYSPD